MIRQPVASTIRTGILGAWAFLALSGAQAAPLALGINSGQVDLSTAVIAPGSGVALVGQNFELIDICGGYPMIESAGAACRDGSGERRCGTVRAHLWRDGGCARGRGICLDVVRTFCGGMADSTPQAGDACQKRPGRRLGDAFRRPG
jgi:hypothetical protein